MSVALQTQSPTGEQLHIEAAGFSATVTEVGATLRELAHEGRDLIAGFPADAIRPIYRGALLIPWPNRLADGAYTWEGVRHQLPINELARMNAIHGLVAWLPWSITRREPDRVELECRLFPTPGYPFRLDLSISYALSTEGLRCELTAVNDGDAAAPYGCASHPYLVAGSGLVDEWTLTVPAARYLEITPDRLLPKEIVPVDGTTADFRRPRRIDGAALNHAFTDLSGDEVRLSGEYDVALRMHEGFSWVQVYSSDEATGSYHRAALGVEPMSCPPDAFNSGMDLVTLRPGGRHYASWSITSL